MSKKIADTLLALSTDDWNQRYSNSLINYDSKIRFCSEVYRGDRGVVKMYFRDDMILQPQVAAKKVNIRYVDIVAAGGFVVPQPPPPLFAPREQVLENFEIEGRLQKEKRHQVELKESKAEEVLIKLDKLSHLRPESGWYQYGPKKASYFFYTDQRQFCRGFSRNNTNLFSGYDYGGPLDVLRDVLTQAFKGSCSTITEKEYPSLELTETKLLSNVVCLVKLQHDRINIFFRTTHIGDLYPNGQLKSHKRFFIPELQKYFPTYKISPGNLNEYT